MTYSHNCVSNNFKMTTTTAVDAKTIRLKKMSHGGGVGNVNRNTPTAAIHVTVHSNSIDSSTNYQSYYHQQQVLSSSPPGSAMSSGASTSSTSSDSSICSNGISSGHSSSRQSKHQQRKQQQTQQQQQHDSPQLTSGSDSGIFFSNNNQYPTYHGGRRGGSGHKLRDGQKSPHFQHQQQLQQQQTRQSPAVILGGGENPLTINNSGSACRKTRAKFAVSNSPLFGKISPTQLLIPNALTHFAGSKCFDAPSPTALPKPPQHWTLGKAEHKATSSAGPGLHSVTTARNPALAADAHTCGGHVVKHSKRNLLDDFDTHNLKLLLNVQS